MQRSVGLYTGWGHDPLIRNPGDLLCLKAAERLLGRQGIRVVDVRSSIEKRIAPWEGDLIIGGGTVLPTVFIQAPGLTAARTIMIFGSGVLSPAEMEVRNLAAFDRSPYKDAHVIGVRGPQSARDYKYFFGKDVDHIGDLVFAFAHPRPVSEKTDEVVFVIIENAIPHRRQDSSYKDMLDLYTSIAKDARMAGYKKVLCLSTRSYLDMEQLVRDGRFDEVRAVSSPEDFTSAIQSSRFVFTERLHPAILATNSGTPFLYFQTTPKSRDLEELLVEKGGDSLSSFFVDMSQPQDKNIIIERSLLLHVDQTMSDRLILTANTLKDGLERAAGKAAALLNSSPPS